ncbi:DUF1801 domain-containing protein [Pedobacter polaris]|uniref:DUF1801 domain-containing protein n=1 Tax=Pedobacter polaris TaxID=2571273 RepID=A0A4U1CXS9_9SPHI|nr:DUF1801 domain-containing protein [Pedobacter polaris]TKC13235.1 DUF1801 domain-containing protein [Pedobacter polaris]
MAKNKTTTTDDDVIEFIHAFAETAQKQEDSMALIQLMQRVSGHPPKMYGPSIVGFGNYHYKYASGHEGDAPLLGFSPRKAAISLYVYTGLKEHEPLLSQLGKFKMGKACIYANKLSDINQQALETLMKTTIDFLTTKYKL